MVLQLDEGGTSFLILRIEKSRILICFQLALLSLVSHLCKVFDAITSKLDEVLSINSSANAIVLGDVNVH